MKTKEDIIKEINALIDQLEDACGIDLNETVKRIRELIGML